MNTSKYLWFSHTFNDIDITAVKSLVYFLAHLINIVNSKQPLIDMNCLATIGWLLKRQWVVGRGVPCARHLNTTVLPSVAFLLDVNVSIVDDSENINRNYKYFAHHVTSSDFQI